MIRLRPSSKALSSAGSESNYKDTDRPKPRITSTPIENVGSKDEKSSVFSIDNILWLMGSMFVFYWSDIGNVILFDKRLDKLWLYLGLMLIGINFAFAIYFIVWLSYIKKVPSSEWEKKNPIAIPIATIAFVTGSFCCMLGLWPVWGILTPVILYILFMGFIVLVSILPEW